MKKNKSVFITRITVVIFVLLFSSNAFSQNWGQLGATIGETIILKKIINNPNLQSVDMRNYIAYVNSGTSSYNSGNYADAVNSYLAAMKIANNTSDYNLKLLYNKYQWAQTLLQDYNNANSMYQAQLRTQQQQQQTQQSTQQSMGGTVYNYSTPSSSSSTTTQSTGKTAHPKRCTQCGGTGRCHLCNGRGVYSPTMSGKEVRCSKCGGNGRCVLCGGSGSLGTEYY